MKINEIIIEAANPAQQAAIAISKKKDQGVAEGSENILPRGTAVTVLHKGKQVPGKIVRYDAGKGGYSNAYVVDIGEYESIFVPTNKIQQGVAEDWNKVNKSDKTSGMSQKAVNAYRRENPGSKLKTAVTTKPSKLKAGSKDAKRRKSFCARMSGNKGPMKKPNGKPTPKALALRRWNCESIEQMEQLVMIAEQKIRNLRK